MTTKKISKNGPGTSNIQECTNFPSVNIKSFGISCTSLVTVFSQRMHNLLLHLSTRPKSPLQTFTPTHKQARIKAVLSCIYLRCENRRNSHSSLLLLVSTSFITFENR